MLVVICGLPATGKSTIASSLARRTGTPYLRVDRIEQAIVAWSGLSHPVGPVGYAVAHELAGEQLSLGLDVIVECVNPIALTRDSWVRTAEAAHAGIVEVELICSDVAEHKRRILTRPSDVEGLIKPTWPEVTRRDYEAWSRPHLIVDSATTKVSDAVELIAGEVAAARSRCLRPGVPRLST
jgi:predicted kinase